MVEDASIRGVSYCVLASAWSRLAYFPPYPGSSPSWRQGPLLRIPPDVSFLECFRPPSLAPEDSDARPRWRAKTRRMSWIPRPGGPPSPHPWLCTEDGDRLWFLWVAEPLRRDEYQRHGESFPQHLLFAHREEMVYSDTRGVVYPLAGATRLPVVAESRAHGGNYPPSRSPRLAAREIARSTPFPLPYGRL